MFPDFKPTINSLKPPLFLVVDSGRLAFKSNVTFLECPITVVSFTNKKLLPLIKGITHPLIL